jgi:uncharacterized protein (UPF0147 family)
MQNTQQLKSILDRIAQSKDNPQQVQQLTEQAKQQLQQMEQSSGGQSQQQR